MPDADRRQVAVHRCRFIDCVPQAIEWLSFEPGCERLAVLRANADLEVWSSTAGGWHRELFIAGVVDAPVRRVAFGKRTPSFPEGRLFSCGLHGMCTEWDLSTLSPHSSWDTQGGAAWAMALDHNSDTLAVACEDGGASLFRLTV